MTTETSAARPEAHQHHFPCQPPRGSLTSPGDCSCGMTYRRNKALSMLDAAVRAILATEPGGPRGLPGDRPAFRARTDWAVAWGSEDINDGIGFVDLYDDEQDAHEHVMLHSPGAVVARRTVIRLPWVTVPSEETAAS